jgi:hypothetical protein
VQLFFLDCVVLSEQQPPDTETVLPEKVLVLCTFIVTDFLHYHVASLYSFQVYHHHSPFYIPGSLPFQFSGISPYHRGEHGI